MAWGKGVSLTGMKEKLEEFHARVGMKTITGLNHGLPKAGTPTGIRFALGWDFEIKKILLQVKKGEFVRSHERFGVSISKQSWDHSHNH